MHHRGIVSVTYPMQQGVIHCSDDLEKLLYHTLHEELKLDSFDRVRMQNTANKL